MFESQFIRFFVLLAIFASVFLIIQITLRLTVDKRAYSHAVNKRLKLISQGIDREAVIAKLRKNDHGVLAEDAGLFARAYFKFRRNLLMAAVPFGPLEVGLGMGILFVLLSLIIAGAVWSGGIAITAGVIQLIIAFAASLAIAIPLLIVNFLAERRRKKMQEQFPVSVDIFVRALRSGHPIASAIDLLTKEMEDPIGSEFGLVADEVSYGADLADALNAMAERWNLDDIRMFVVSLSIQSETGGNLAEILENLSNVIRERTSLLLKVRALSSEGRMTGWLLTALPIITFVILFMSNPSFYLDVAPDPIFYIGFPMLVCWFLLGVVWIRNLINLEV